MIQLVCFCNCGKGCPGREGAGPELKPPGPGPILPTHLHPQPRSHSGHHWDIRTSFCLLGRKTVKTSRKTSGRRYRTKATHENLPRKTTTFLPDSYRQWPYLPGRGPKTRQMLPGDSSQIFFTQLLEKGTEKMNPWPSSLSSTDPGFPISA